MFFHFGITGSCYSVCVDRVLKQNTTGECQHFNDAERCLDGTWVIDEVRLAVNQGYKILEIQEVYQYEVTQYNPDTDEGGLFVEYINTFFKFKAEASGYPSWVPTPTMKIYTFVNPFRAKASNWTETR